MDKLVKIESNLAIKNEIDMNEYLKPMSRDISLFDSTISGTYRLKDKTALLNIKEGDKLNFQVSSSKFSEDIELHDVDDKIVGYISEADSVFFMKLMKAGKYLFAIVRKVDKSASMPLINIEIFLKDF